jgi:hypothetical protein
LDDVPRNGGGQSLRFATEQIQTSRRRLRRHSNWVDRGHRSIASGLITGSAVRAVRPHELKLRHKAIPNQGIFNVISKQN